jgi:pimeloyl-ACP methyl ester carboxylesterase
MPSPPSVVAAAALDVDVATSAGSSSHRGDRRRLYTAPVCAAPCVLLSLLFVVLWGANTSLLTTGTVLGLAALVTLAGAMMFLENKTTTTGKTTSAAGGKIVLAWLGSLAALFGCMAIVFLVGAGREWRTYIADQTLAALSSLVGAIVCAVVAHGLRLRKKATTAVATRCWASCCACCGLPVLIICVIVVLWSNAMDVQTMALAPPGVLVPARSSDDPTLHLFCSDAGHNASLPTIVFLHGYGGSSRDAHAVRTDPRFTASGLRLCSLDRPGYGWSEGYATIAQADRHFGKIADLTLDVLAAQGIAGDLVLMFHSLGGYHALSLSAAISKRRLRDQPEPPQWRVRGMVAVDAMTPGWFDYEVPRTASECGTAVALAPTGWFWPAVRVVTPTGLPRLVYATGFGGFSDSVGLYGGLANTMLNLNMRRKYIDSRLTESARWGLNCGYALKGQNVLQAAAANEYVALEVLVVIHGLNLTEFGAIASNSTAVNVSRIDLTGQYSTSVSQHEALMLAERASREYVVPAVLRVVRAVVRRDAAV